ncbi:hypothetical protein MK632_18900 [Rhizobium changzhiense]|uniref:hypothetical protein n=1 Tax=Rhizobium changzhiense TaxID=2692317 RepID=UPI001F0C73C0|nr:hypothetical protein [Rhizobium changzhiense]MCH4547818.1 hypothetical protein [Rhizobium changzhiense]
MSVLLEQCYEVPSRMNCQWVMPKKRAAVREVIFSAVQHCSLVSEVQHHAFPFGDLTANPRAEENIFSNSSDVTSSGSSPFASSTKETRRSSAFHRQGGARKPASSHG